MRKCFVALSTLFLLFLFACKSNNNNNNETQQQSTEDENEQVEIDKSITPANAFNNLFLDSSKINDFLAKHPEYNNFAKQYQNFYKVRNYEYAWFDTSGVGEQATNFVSLVNSTIADQNDSSLYNKKMMTLYNKFITDSNAVEDRQTMLQTEMYLTGQFLQYVAKVYKGKDISAEDLNWFIPRKKVVFAKAVDSTVANKGEDEDRIFPRNKQYKKLQAAITQYYNIRNKVGWDSIPAPSKGYKPGDSSAAITLIKQRLQLLGDMSQGDTTHQYNAALKTAVQSFQDRLGLKTDGILTAATMHELNYPIEGRIKQLLINLERDRWMPAETDSSYIMVNIPEYKLHLYENGKQQFGMNVIVGKEGTGTVIFTGKLKYIVFSPYWNVPQSIVEKEIVPGMDNDPNYLADHHMEITGQDNGLPVVRQLPGDDNSLGHVKFLFPNSYDIYLHDTNAKYLFNMNKRAYSHGCIRLADAEKMANYILRNEKDWDSVKIHEAMDSQEEKWVKLKNQEPVLITYLTTWVDENGRLNTRDDIYGHDASAMSRLFNGF